MSTHVWDASAALKLIVQEPGSAQARAVLSAASRSIVLDWTAMEVANALRKRVARGATDKHSARVALHLWRRIALEAERADDLAALALDLALDNDHTVYDCAYIALALLESAILVTADAVQSRVAGRCGVDVVWIDSAAG
mgnify:CR=1 FL=1